MLITETQIKGCYVVECNRHYDSRGFFQELYSDNTYDDLVQRWEQINWSESSKGVFRGIHNAARARHGPVARSGAMPVRPG